MNRQIGVRDFKCSKNFLLRAGHVIRRLLCSSKLIVQPMDDVISHKSRTDRRKNFEFDGGVDHMTRNVWQVF